MPGEAGFALRAQSPTSDATLPTRTLVPLLERIVRPGNEGIPGLRVPVAADEAGNLGAGIARSLR